MAYRLEPDKPVAKELSRVVASEFDKVLEDIVSGHASRPAEVVHEARKRVKKIRAVLHLLQKDLGADYRVQDRRLRTIAHQLSPLRDVDATINIMKAVRKHYPRLITPLIFAAVRRGLAGRKREIVARADPGRLLRRVARTLRRSANTMPQQVRRAAGSAAVEAGLVRGYRRARKAMASAQAAPEDLSFHAWRRRLKDHWYHVRLLEQVDARVHDRARRLKALETWLGHDHDLVLLRMAILEAPARYGDERATAVVLGCAEKYHATLRRRALKAGHRMLNSKPRAFRKSLERAWRRQQARSK